MILGIGGSLVLISLGIWQLERLSQKQAILQDIQLRLLQDPVDLGTLEAIDSVRDNYRPVRVAGEYQGTPLYILVSQKPWGPGFLQISAFKTATKTIMVERGFIPDVEKNAIIIPDIPVTLDVILHWPQETGYFTPAPDLKQNIWFARDVDTMAEALGASPVLAVAQPLPQKISQTQKWPKPVITDMRSAPNNHLQYAITWFLLGLIWLIMSAIWAKKIRNTILYFSKNKN